MRLLTSILFILFTSVLFHAAEIVGGVEYSLHNGAYVVTGYDQAVPPRTIHILSELNGLDVTAIAANAFEDNTDLLYCKIDASITEVGENAFARCSALRQVVLPDGLTGIKEETFAYCTSLTSVAIPSTVTSIGAHAFTGCTSVSDVWFTFTDDSQLNSFGWWDGVYAREGEDEHGGLEFGTNEHTKVHVPAGMLQNYINSEKFTAWLGAIVEDNNTYTLSWIVNYGTIGKHYTISDDITAIYTDRNGTVYAKDNGGYLTPDISGDGEVDLMWHSDIMRGRAYDQSNWVALMGKSISNGRAIAGKSVTGTLLSKLNPTIAIDDDCTPMIGETMNYSLNVYAPVSLMGRTQQGNNAVTYAFVQPKPQEFAIYDWAICLHDYGTDYNGAVFSMPATTADYNYFGLNGAFAISDKLYESDTRQDLLAGNAYRFTAITRRGEAGEAGNAVLRISGYTPASDSEITTAYSVFPTAFEDAIITGIDNVASQYLPSTAKLIDHNGQIIIIHGNSVYNVLGNKLNFTSTPMQ